MEAETMVKTLKEAISNVLETMFFQPVQFVDFSCSLQEWFSGRESLLGATLDFRGPSSGSLFFLAPLKVLREMTANFLGLSEEKIDKDQQADTVKEILNMMGGQMLSLIDKEGLFKIGIPELIDIHDQTDTRLGGLKGDKLLIQTEDNRLAAGILLD